MGRGWNFLPGGYPCQSLVVIVVNVLVDFQVDCAVLNKSLEIRAIASERFRQINA